MLTITKKVMKPIPSACPTLETLGSVGSAIICLPLPDGRNKPPAQPRILPGIREEQ